MLVASNLEDNVGGGGGLDLEGGTAEGVVLAQQVVGGLSEILYAASTRLTLCSDRKTAQHIPSRMGGQAEGETW